MGIKLIRKELPITEGSFRIREIFIEREISFLPERLAIYYFEETNLFRKQVKYFRQEVWVSLNGNNWDDNEIFAKEEQQAYQSFQFLQQAKQSIIFKINQENRELKIHPFNHLF